MMQKFSNYFSDKILIFLIIVKIVWIDMNPGEQQSLVLTDKQGYFLVFLILLNNGFLICRF